MSTSIAISHGYTEWLRDVDKETARLIVLWAIQLYGPKKLGITRSYAHQLRRGERQPSQELLNRALETMTAKDLLQLVRILGDYHGECWARRLAWLGRRPHTAEVRGSNPRGPTIPLSNSYMPRPWRKCSGHKAYIGSSWQKRLWPNPCLEGGREENSGEQR